MNRIKNKNITISNHDDNFFLGNIFDAQNLDRLTQNSITHIINCTPDLPLYWENKYQYMRIDVLDLPSQNIRKHFDQAIDFIG
jgi:hypothetical protein